MFPAFIGLSDQQTACRCKLWLFNKAKMQLYPYKIQFIIDNQYFTLYSLLLSSDTPSYMASPIYS
jgi:hypothetical protein